MSRTHSRKNRPSSPTEAPPREPRGSRGGSGVDLLDPAGEHLGAEALLGGDPADDDLQIFYWGVGLSEEVSEGGIPREGSIHWKHLVDGALAEPDRAVAEAVAVEGGEDTRLDREDFFDIFSN